MLISNPFKNVQKVENEKCRGPKIFAHNILKDETTEFLLFYANIYFFEFIMQLFQQARNSIRDSAFF
jgi:hypothetical protein